MSTSCAGFSESRSSYSGRRGSGTHLVRCTEDVGIVLLEPADSCQTRQSARQLVAMQNTKVGKADWQLSPRPRPMIKHQTGQCMTTNYQNLSIWWVSLVTKLQH